MVILTPKIEQGVSLLSTSNSFQKLTPIKIKNKVTKHFSLPLVEVGKSVLILPQSRPDTHGLASICLVADMNITRKVCALCCTHTEEEKREDKSKDKKWKEKNKIKK
jgi:hypothetical protein